MNTFFNCLVSLVYVSILNFLSFLLIALIETGSNFFKSNFSFSNFLL
jgi:hypothetical protein